MNKREKQIADCLVEKYIRVINYTFATDIAKTIASLPIIGERLVFEKVGDEWICKIDDNFCYVIQPRKTSLRKYCAHTVNKYGNVIHVITVPQANPDLKGCFDLTITACCTHRDELVNKLAKGGAK